MDVISEEGLEQARQAAMVYQLIGFITDMKLKAEQELDETLAKCHAMSSDKAKEAFMTFATKRQIFNDIQDEWMIIRGLK